MPSVLSRKSDTTSVLSSPRRFPGLDEAFHFHAQVHEPAAIAEPRRPRDTDEGGGRAQPERPALLDEYHERRAPRLGLASLAAAALGDGLGEEPEAPLADHAEPALLDIAGERRVGLAQVGAVLHLARPEEVEVLRDVVATERGRNDEAPEHVDRDGAGALIDPGSDHQWPDGERGIGPRGEEELGARRSGGQEHHACGQQPEGPGSALTPRRPPLSGRRHGRTAARDASGE